MPSTSASKIRGIVHRSSRPALLVGCRCCAPKVSHDRPVERESRRGLEAERYLSEQRAERTEEMVCGHRLTSEEESFDRS